MRFSLWFRLVNWNGQDYEILERFHEERESATSADRSQLQNLLTFRRLNTGRVHLVVVF